MGAFLTSSESTQAIVRGLDSIVQLAGDSAFYGRGEDGPELFMTDNCAAERQAISDVFPGAGQLLCTFHVLQACWRYLWSRESGKINIFIDINYVNISKLWSKL